MDYREKGFPKVGVPFLGVPVIRILVYWGLCWGPLMLGNYHIKKALGYHRNNSLFTWFVALPVAKHVFWYAPTKISKYTWNKQSLQQASIVRRMVGFIREP